MPSLTWFRRWHSRHPHGRGKIVLSPENHTQPVLPSAGLTATVPPSSGPANKPQYPAASLPDVDKALPQPPPEDSSHSGILENAAPNQTTTGANGEVMRATVTDVQQAPSSRGESTDHETYRDTDADADGQDLHRGARRKLVENAKAIAEQIPDVPKGRTPMRSPAPPIDVELSSDYSPSIQLSERFIVTSLVSTTPHPESENNEGAVTEKGVATATQPSPPQNEQARTQDNNSLVPIPILPPGVRGIHNGISVANYSYLGLPVSPLKTSGLQEGAGGLPSPTASWNGHQHGHSISSATSSTLVATSPSLSITRKSRSIDPVEWSIEEVVDWLRSKGFDEVVCDKFIEQEITGDVLFELDSAILKSEFGTIPFGKRIRIARAITDLLRPPSSSAEQHTGPGSLSQGSPLSPQCIPLGPMSQSSPNGPPKVPPDSEDLTHPSVPSADPDVWWSDATEFYFYWSIESIGEVQSDTTSLYSSETSAESNGGDKTSPYSSTNTSGGVRWDATSPYNESDATSPYIEWVPLDQSRPYSSANTKGGVQSDLSSPYSNANTNGGVQSDLSSPYSSVNTNGEVQSNETSPYSSANTNRGIRSNALPPTPGTNAMEDDIEVQSDDIWQNVLTRFGPPNPLSTSKLPSPYMGTIDDVGYDDIILLFKGF